MIEQDADNCRCDIDADQPAPRERGHERSVGQVAGGTADWAALGASIAAKASNRIPAVLNLPIPITNEAAKIITACASPGMNDPMLHLIGISPESPTLEAAFGGTMPADVQRLTLTLADVREIYRKLSSAKTDKVDIVYVGCPHLQYYEILEIARLIDGKRVNEGVNLWVQTDTPSYYMARHHGDAQVIEKAGGKIYHSTCFGLLPIRDLGSNVNVVTNSFKAIKLMGGQGQGWIFGTSASPELELACYAGFSTIFQYESFLMTFPSRNSQWSHPLTRTRRPSGVVPVRSHSETPRLPATQCRSSL